MYAAIIDIYRGEYCVRTAGGDRVIIPADSAYSFVHRPCWFISGGNYWHISMSQMIGNESVSIQVMKVDSSNLKLTTTRVKFPVGYPINYTCSSTIDMIARENDRIGVLEVGSMTDNRVYYVTHHYMLYFEDGNVRVGGRLSTIKYTPVKGSYYITVWDPIRHRLHLLYSWPGGLVDLLGVFSMKKYMAYSSATIRDGVLELRINGVMDHICMDTCKTISTNMLSTRLTTPIGEHFTIQLENNDEYGNADITITDLRTGDKYVVDRKESGDTPPIFVT